MVEHHGQRKHLQSGLALLGLATMSPDCTPTAFDPFDPILLSTPDSAIGVSDAMKSSRVLLARPVFGRIKELTNGICAEIPTAMAALERRVRKSIL